MYAMRRWQLHLVLLILLSRFDVEIVVTAAAEVSEEKDPAPISEGSINGVSVSDEDCTNANDGRQMDEDTQERRLVTTNITTGFCAQPLATGGTSSCVGAGKSCSTNRECCSKYCVPCNNADRCGGSSRCGMSVKTNRDSIYTFYYAWYGSRAYDGKWTHWNSPLGAGHDADNNDIASSYFPLLGPYSSANKTVIHQHMLWMQQAGIGVAVLSFWGSRPSSTQIWDIFDAADDVGIKVAFYIEPYGKGYDTGGDRTPYTASVDVMNLTDTFGCHRAMHRINGRPVFLFFANNSYKLGSQADWKIVWNQLHANKRYNPMVIMEGTKLQKVMAGGWDGGHAYGCSPSLNAMPNWYSTAREYDAAGKLFFFTACPGFDNTRSSPDPVPVLSRENGTQYQKMWKNAINSKTKSTKVVVTSFNEWHEGSNIEPAIPMSTSTVTYQNFEGAWNTTGTVASKIYLKKTKEYSNKFLGL